MLLKACAKCGNLIPYGATYCDKCRAIVEAYRAEQKEAQNKEAKRRYNKRYNATRDKRYTQFYNSSAWKMLSQRYTQDRGYKCEQCGAIATEVHHKEPIQSESGWNKRFDYDNLELLCKDCHNKRHNRFQKKNS